VRAILGSVVDAIERARAADMTVVAPRLMAYGRALDFDAKWALACDVYRTILAHAHPAEEPDVAVDASMRLGYCARMLGDLEGSAAAYGRAGQVAAAAGDLMGVLKARVGESKIALAHGNLPRAEQILDETIVRAGASDFTELRAMALHDRAAVAHRRGDYERAVRLGYEALQSTSSPIERDRLLADIAGFFVELGVRSAARDAHLVLAATAQEQYPRWVATINLLEIAALDETEPVFEQYRRELADADLPPTLRVEYHLHVGRGFRIFGKVDAARAELTKVLQLAEQHRLNDYVFTAERELSELDRGERLRGPAAAAAPAGVQDVANALREMRETAAVAGV
jgi:tetratricopeptide (TPR) repeat protein